MARRVREALARTFRPLFSLAQRTIAIGDTVEPLVTAAATATGGNVEVQIEALGGRYRPESWVERSFIPAFKCL